MTEAQTPALEACPTRDPVALAMLAAWLNVSVDQIPPENRAHLNPSTMAVWKRVAEAALNTRAKPALEPCQKCNDTRAYAYDENHSKPCEACCPHDQGWWPLRKHYSEDNGKYCCGRGCGETRWPEELGVDAPAFIENTRPSPASKPVAGPPFVFDRYINGTLMAEGVSIEREDTLEAAVRVAAKIAPRGPNGETPVLVLAHPPADRALLDEAAEIIRAICHMNARTHAQDCWFRAGIAFLAKQEPKP